MHCTLLAIALAVAAEDPNGSGTVYIGAVVGTHAQGIVVLTVLGDSPGERAGLRTGDVIVGLEGENFRDPNAFRQEINAQEIGSTVTTQIRRGDETFDLPITLDRYGHLLPGNEATAARILDDYLTANDTANGSAKTPAREPGMRT